MIKKVLASSRQQVSSIQLTDWVTRFGDREKKEGVRNNEEALQVLRRFLDASNSDDYWFTEANRAEALRLFKWMISRNIESVFHLGVDGKGGALRGAYKRIRGCPRLFSDTRSYQDVTVGRVPDLSLTEYGALTFVLRMGPLLGSALGYKMKEDPWNLALFSALGQKPFSLFLGLANGMAGVDQMLRSPLCYKRPSLSVVSVFLAGAVQTLNAAFSVLGTVSQPDQSSNFTNFTTSTGDTKIPSSFAEDLASVGQKVTSVGYCVLMIVALSGSLVSFCKDQKTRRERQDLIHTVKDVVHRMSLILSQKEDSVIHKDSDPESLRELLDVLLNKRVALTKGSDSEDAIRHGLEAIVELVNWVETLETAQKYADYVSFAGTLFYLGNFLVFPVGIALSLADEQLFADIAPGLLYSLAGISLLCNLGPSVSGLVLCSKSHSIDPVFNKFRTGSFSVGLSESHRHRLDSDARDTHTLEETFNALSQLEGSLSAGESSDTVSFLKMMFMAMMLQLMLLLVSE